MGQRTMPARANETPCSTELARVARVGSGAAKTCGQGPTELVHRGGYDVAAAEIVGTARLAHEARCYSAGGAAHDVDAGTVLDQRAVPAPREMNATRGRGRNRSEIARIKYKTLHPQSPAQRTKFSSCCITALKVRSLYRARAVADMHDATSVSLSMTRQLLAMQGTGWRP
jgi:hypothetical protein